MRPQVMHRVLFVVVLIGTRDSWSDFTLPQIGQQTETPDGNRPERENYKRHPCIAGNGTVPTSKGLILCLVPTEKELKRQLKDIGGLNTHYAAVTKEEADKFTNLLSRPRPTLPQKQEAKPFPIIWSYLSSGKSHKKKIIFLNVKPESRNPKDASRNHKTVSHKFKSTARNLRDMLSSVDLRNNIINSKKTRCVHSGEQTEYGLYRLCTECQRISKLKSDRFPRYINEVACPNKIPKEMGHNTGCRRNQGMCIQRFIFTDFLVRTEKFVEVPSPNPNKFSKAFKQVWQPYTQKIRSCCECQLAFNI